MDDLLKFNNINLDVLTETYNMPFYMSYMSKWPEAFTGESSTRRVPGTTQSVVCRVPHDVWNIEQCYKMME